MKNKTTIDDLKQILIQIRKYGLVLQNVGNIVDDNEKIQAASDVIEELNKINQKIKDKQ